MTTVNAGLVAALADRYRIERELGQGGMATVYLAEDIRHHRKVAVKVLRPEIASTLGGERFFREIEVAARLQHPNILPLLDSGAAGGFLYYVMPYVEGDSLRERIARQGELPVHDAVKILIEVVDALACAHERGVVHRDIKPDNIMLSGRHALVMDFGVAKAVSEATGSNQLTSAGIALGTPAYMAPEQAAADPNLDHRVDIYAVGVLGYELLTGRPTFIGRSPQEVLAAHVTQQPEPVTQRRPGVSPALNHILMKCLAKRPADRWQSAEELLHQLEPLATPSGGMTPTSTQPYAAVGRPGKFRPLAIVSVLGILAAIGIAWLLRTRPDHAAPASDSLPSIAVLPFTELAPPPGQEYFADGLTDEVITKLSRIPGLRVPGRASSFYFKDTKSDLRSIADSLHVGALLSATIQRSADRVRVRAQLINAADGFQLWSDTYDGKLEDIFTVYDDVARGISNALQVKIAGRADSAAPHPPVLPEAYDAFLLGGQYLATRRIDSALPLLARAVALDSTFAPGWSSLAVAHAFSTPAQYSVKGVTGASGLRAAHQAVDRAFALDSLSAEAHTAAGFIAILEHKYDDADRELRRGIQLNPNYPQAHHHLALLRLISRDYAGAIAEERKAQQLDPLSMIVGDWLALELWVAGQEDESLREFDRLLNLHRTSERIWGDAALIHLRAGDMAGAARLYQGTAQRLYRDSSLALRWRDGLLDQTIRARTGVEIADSIVRGRFDVLAFTGNLAEARRQLAKEQAGPGLFGGEEFTAWMTHPELRRSPEYRRLAESLMPSIP